MIPYYALFIIIIGSSLWYYDKLQKTGKPHIAKYRKKYDRRYLNIVAVSLILVMGLRNVTVGCDLIQYLYRYENADLFFKQGFLSTEWGYNYFSYFLHDILSLDFQVLVFITAVLCTFSILELVWDYSENRVISIIMYICLGTFGLCMSGIRQAIAMSFVYLSISQIENKKLVRFILLILIAFTFHNSAIIFLPMYFLRNIKLSKRQCVILLITVVAALGYKDVLNPIIAFLSPAKYASFDLSEGYNINPLVIIVPIVFCLYSLLFFTNIEFGNIKKTKLNYKNSFFYILGCIQIFLLILSMNNNQLGRLSYYFAPGLFIVAASAINNHKRVDFRLATIIEAVIICLCIGYFIISTPNGTLRIDNYMFFWEG